MDKVKLTVCNSGEVMVHWPSGRVEFMEWFAALKLVWALLRRAVEFEVTE